MLEIRNYAIKEGIEYVYVGNVHDLNLESTYCPKCGKLVIWRGNYRVLKFNLDCTQGVYRCPRCGYKIPITGKYVMKF
ncbi:MAG: hypothetical protein B7O98_06595 [Zestosphaera tikiterensis]|uniref:Uncharacterized protein n=1 Tax=Zestosphaera tikiterensis TaxID=1973259 RepID=A0A2R7Y474_9CREN|nr:MAG: hypothetical protein B7O98_06595 [Zestosphaera tikiterensis]